jgi:hypothetical protein
MPLLSVAGYFFVLDLHAALDIGLLDLALESSIDVDSLLTNKLGLLSRVQSKKEVDFFVRYNCGVSS